MKRKPLQRTLYLVVCAAPPACNIETFIELAQKETWDVCVIATPQALNFIDIAQIAQLTNHAVRSEYKKPGTEDAFPKADAIAVVPATFNTINKLTMGIADTLALGILCEAIGRNVPFADISATGS